MTASDRLPLSTVTLIFGVLSIPLAFLSHLCSLAVILGLLSIAFYIWSRFQIRRKYTYSDRSLRNMRIGGIAGIAGLVAGVVMWVLWATNVLLR